MTMLNDTYDPSTNLTHFPTSMAKYGQNQYGENRYRIISTASRRHLVGGLWADGATEYRWVPTYRHIPEPWVLEAWDTCRMTMREWDNLKDPRSGWLINGPYPSRGEYYHAHTFTCPVVDANLDKLIMWLEEGKKRSWQDNLDACKQDYEADTKDRQGRMDAIVRSALPAYCSSPAFSGGAVSRGSKTAPILLTADQVVMPNGRPAPVGNNKFTVAQNPRPPRRRVA